MTMIWAMRAIMHRAPTVQQRRSVDDFGTLERPRRLTPKPRGTRKEQRRFACEQAHLHRVVLVHVQKKPAATRADQSVDLRERVEDAVARGLKTALQDRVCIGGADHLACSNF